MQQMIRSKTSLSAKCGVVQFQGDVREMFFCCFAFVEYVLLKNDDILQSMCDLECYAWSAAEH